jgi:hypothetical protein
MASAAEKTRNRLIEKDSKINLKIFNQNKKRKGLPATSFLDHSTNVFLFLFVVSKGQTIRGFVLKTDINERFLYACENGDYPTVVFVLEALKDFSIDVTDSLGRSALRLAVENEHLEVI